MKLISTYMKVHIFSYGTVTKREKNTPSFAKAWKQQLGKIGISL